MMRERRMQIHKKNKATRNYIGNTNIHAHDVSFTNRKRKKKEMGIAKNKKKTKKRTFLQVCSDCIHHVKHLLRPHEETSRF